MTVQLSKDEKIGELLHKALGILAALVTLAFCTIMQNTNVIKELIWWDGLLLLLAVTLLTRVFPTVLAPVFELWQAGRWWRWALGFLFLYFLWGIISLTFTPEAFRGMVLIARNAGYIVMFLFVAGLLRRSQGEISVLEPVLWAATIASLYGILQYFGIDFLRWKYFDRPVGTFGNPNFLADFLVALVPVLAVRELGLRNSRKGLRLPVRTILVTLAILATQSRGGMLGFAMVVWLGVLFVSTGFKHDRGRAKLLVRRALLLTILAGGIFVSLSVNFFPQSFRHLFSTSTIKLRYELWRGSLELVRERPFSGYGLGSFPEVSLILMPRLEPIVHGQRPAHAHSWPVEFMVDGGVTGLLLFTGFLFFLLKGLSEGAKASTSIPGERLLLMAIIAGISGLLVATSVGVWFNWFGGGWIFYLLAGIGAGIASRPAKCTFSIRRKGTIIAGLLVLLFWVGLTVFFVNVFLASHQAFLGKVFMTSNPKIAVRHYERVFQKFPCWQDFRRSYVASLIKVGRLRGAEKVLHNVVSRGHPDAWSAIFMGKIMTARKEYLRAERYLRGAYKLKPDGSTLMLLLDVLDLEGRTTETLRLSERHLEKELYLPLYHRYLKQQHKLGRTRQARDFLRMLASNPPPWAPLKGMAHILRWEAELSSLLGDLIAAKASYQQALKFDPNNYQLWNDYGLTLWDMGRLEAADKAFSRAEKLKPDEIFVRYNRLELALICENYQLAREEIQHLRTLPLPERLRVSINEIMQRFPQLSE